MSKDNKTKLLNHALHLKNQHDLLDKEISELYNAHENEYKLETLKKQQLKLKDEIERLMVRINFLV